MKKSIGVICFCFYLLPLKSQTLFTYGKHEVSKQSFLKAYYKNNSQEKKGDALAYLKLFINYKLKLQEARDEHLDTLVSQKTDLQNFANQVSASYLLDSTTLIKLAKEAIVRSATEIHLTYLFLPKQPEGRKPTINSLPLFKQFEQLKLDYPNAIFEDLNFVTVFSLPYDIENIVYNLSTNEISKPYAGSDGIYYFEVVEKRAAIIDKIQTAQILVSADPSVTTDDSRARKRADSIYKILIADGNFSATAIAVSDDKSTASNGGLMDEYGISKYSKAFNDKVFALKQINDITQPFKTSYGYHIVKLLSKTPINTSFEETNLAKWKQRVIEDNRVKIAKEKMIENIARMIKVKWNTKINTKKFYAYSDSFLNKKTIPLSDFNNSTTIFKLENKPVYLENWVDYLNLNSNILLGSSINYDSLLSSFERTEVMNYYRENLIDYNYSFREALNEYEEGNLVFELMNENVWLRGSSDSSGLLKYYTTNKDKYDSKKSFDDIRGQVINDYENYLESSMIDRIKTKYPVKINNEVLRTIP